MKRKIRYGVFESNSSSTHSLTLVAPSDYERWENGEVLFNDNSGKFFTHEEAVAMIKEGYGYDEVCFDVDVEEYDEDAVDEALCSEEFFTHERFFDRDDYDTFDEIHTTPGGEVVKVIGYCGWG